MKNIDFSSSFHIITQPIVVETFDYADKYDSVPISWWQTMTQFFDIKK